MMMAEVPTFTRIKYVNKKAKQRKNRRNTSKCFGKWIMKPVIMMTTELQNLDSVVLEAATN